MNVCHLKLHVHVPKYFYTTTFKSYIKIMCLKLLRGGLSQRKQLVVHPSVLLFFHTRIWNNQTFARVYDCQYTQFVSGLPVIPSFNKGVILYIRPKFSSIFVFYFYIIYFISIIILILLCFFSFFSLKITRIYNLNFKKTEINCIYTFDAFSPCSGRIFIEGPYSDKYKNRVVYVWIYQKCQLNKLFYFFLKVFFIIYFVIFKFFIKNISFRHIYLKTDSSENGDRTFVCFPFSVWLYFLHFHVFFCKPKEKNGKMNVYFIGFSKNFTQIPSVYENTTTFL